jgi:hypothetical protein
MNARRFTLACLAYVCALAGASMLVSASALAAAPEAPGAVTVEAVRATGATLRGVLNPSNEGEAGTYEFLYRASKTECQGGAKAQLGLAFGMMGQEVSEGLSGLEPGTEYAVCLLARDLDGETAVGPVATFKTTLALETPRTEPASAITATTATLNGVLNPGGPGEPSAYEFLYKASATQCTEGQLAPEPAGEASGGEKEAVSAGLSGLLPNMQYTFCLLVRNAAEETAMGSPVTFRTSAQAPTIGETSSSDVRSTEVTVSASIEAGGSPTSYHIEYGTGATYGSSTSDVSIGAPTAPVSVYMRLSKLEAGTIYHFHFAAANALGHSEGEDSTFTTTTARLPSASILPDNREYEQVSPPGGGEVYVPSPAPGQSSEQDIGTGLPFRPSDDGNSLVYLAEPPASGKGGNGNQGGGAKGNEYLTARSPGGWGVSDITPPGTQLQTRYEAFSSDLSMGVVKSRDGTPEFPPLTSEVAENSSLIKCVVLYSRINSSGAYHALFSTTQTPGDCGEPLVAGVNEGTTSVPAHTHLLFQTRAALTPGVVAATGKGDDLYDSVNGRLGVVNILPNGVLDPNAVFGGLTSESAAPDFSGVISDDGSRVFWTDLTTGDIYVRENDTQPQSPLGGAGDECLIPADACTVRVSAGAAQYSTATRDGLHAFYIEGGGLWRFDVQNQAREQLVGASGEVQGVIGVNETGEGGAYLYFVADGALGTGPNVEGKAPVSGQPNLYLYRHGETEPTFIATLSSGDNELEPFGVGYGDWQADVGHRTAELTPDGHSAAFVSTMPLTGYSNIEERRQFGLDHRRVPEVFVYDSNTGRIACASCAPDGEPPVESASSSETGVQASSQPTYMTRWISSDGNRVFFDSPQPLAAQDVSRLQDVYEWERNGEGTCHQSTNCVYLLSGGNSTDFSYFVGASASGDDVFFTHRGRLVSQELDGEEMTLYDARVAGGFPETSLACTGTGCQGVPPAPPIFATPSSVTFSGVGNFSPPAETGIKAKPKSKPAKCKRGLVRKRGRCVRAKTKRRKVNARRARANRRGKS